MSNKPRSLQAGQQPEQGGQPLAAHHEQALKAAGVNWQNLPWQQMLALAQALLAALAARQAQAQAQQQPAQGQQSSAPPASQP